MSECERECVLVRVSVRVRVRVCVMDGLGVGLVRVCVSHLSVAEAVEYVLDLPPAVCVCVESVRVRVPPVDGEPVEPHVFLL